MAVEATAAAKPPTAVNISAVDTEALWISSMLVRATPRIIGRRAQIMEWGGLWPKNNSSRQTLNRGPRERIVLTRFTETRAREAYLSTSLTRKAALRGTTALSCGRVRTARSCMRKTFVNRRPKRREEANCQRVKTASLIWYTWRTCFARKREVREKTNQAEINEATLARASQPAMRSLVAWVMTGRRNMSEVAWSRGFEEREDWSRWALVPIPIGTDRNMVGGD